MESTDSTAEDNLLKSYITAARKDVENKTKRSLVTTTWSLTLDDFSNTTQIIELPRSPLSTASTNVTITYIKDTTVGDTTTIGATAFTVDSVSEPGRVYPSFNNEWVTDVRNEPNAVTIQYVSGYSTATTPVPELLKTYMKMTIASLYENREPITSDRVNTLPRNFTDGLLDPYVIKTLI
jgi:uncharacterized phiE125 gp8 family phage protein